MKNKLNVTVSGMSLTVNTDYEKEKADALAEAVTVRLNEILSHSRTYSKLDAALLLLLDTFDERERFEAEYAAMKKKVETMTLDLEIQRIENEKLSGKDNA